MVRDSPAILTIFKEKTNLMGSPTSYPGFDPVSSDI
jgi:hypothetical protein